MSKSCNDYYKMLYMLTLCSERARELGMRLPERFQAQRLAFRASSGMPSSTSVSCQSALIYHSEHLSLRPVRWEPLRVMLQGTQVQ